MDLNEQDLVDRALAEAEALASAYSLKGTLQVFRQSARAAIEALVRAGQRDLTQLARYGASEGTKAVGPIRK